MPRTYQEFFRISGHNGFNWARWRTIEIEKADWKYILCKKVTKVFHWGDLF